MGEIEQPDDRLVLLLWEYDPMRILEIADIVYKILYHFN